MPLDRYLPCPGGTGKKIKFCCTDLFGDLEQIQRMLEGDQRLAALEHVNRSLATHPDRPCLLAIKCLLARELDQPEQLQSTLDTFRQKHPDNPVMLAELSLSRAEADGASAGVEPLQQALASLGEQMPTRVYQAIGLVGRMLLGGGWIVAGRAHLLLQAALAGSHDTSAAALLSRLNRAADVPLLLKQDQHLELPPEDLPRKADFRAALETAMRGAWRAAAERFADIAPESDRLPAVWHNLALLRAWLADHAGAVAALRTLTALDIPPDDAIEAEALAQLLDSERQGELLDELLISYPVEDVADVQARLAADRRVWRLAVDLRGLAPEGQPPPLAALRLLDRPLPASGADLRREEVPRVLAQLFVFGRETDRPARVELIALRGPELDAARRTLAEALGRELPAPAEEEVVRRVLALEHALRWQWQLPPDTPPPLREALSRAEFEHVILSTWPALANPALEGKSPAELAADPAFHVRLAAAMLNLEQAAGGPADAEIFGRLRAQLGVAAPQPIEPGDVDFHALPAVRLSRLKVEALSDDDLLECFRQAAWYHVAPALARLAAEVIARPSLDDKVDKAEAHGLLAEVTDDAQQRLEHIDQARRLTERRGESSAPWDLAELAVQLEQGRGPEVERIMQHLRSSHMQEPGVAEALMQLLYRMGLVGPDGRPRGAVAPEAAAAPSIVLPGETTAARGQIWTPGGAAPASATEKKSVLWTPGSP